VVVAQDRDEVLVGQTGEQIRLPREVASRVFVAA
jgi:DtxR family Mn-dependent transcriptional regulator